MLEIAKLHRPRERITREGDVVIAEHDKRALKARQEGLEARHASRMGDEVSGDTDQIGSPFPDPPRSLLARAVSTRERRARQVASRQQFVWPWVSRHRRRACGP